MARETAPLDAVSCIACGTVYVKPAARGDSDAGKKCPACTHDGWIAVGLTERTPEEPAPCP